MYIYMYTVYIARDSVYIYVTVTRVRIPISICSKAAMYAFITSLSSCSPCFF